jgi:hypothetical protein
MRIVVAVKSSKMDDHVAFADEFLQLFRVIEVTIFERYACYLFLLQSEEIEQVRSDESGLAGDADVYHMNVKKFLAELRIV